MTDLYANFDPLAKAQTVIAEGAWQSVPVGKYLTLSPSRFLNRWRGETRARVSIPVPSAIAPEKFLEVFQAVLLVQQITGDASLQNTYGYDKAQALWDAFKAVADEAGGKPSEMHGSIVTSFVKNRLELEVSVRGSLLNKMRAVVGKPAVPTASKG